MARNKKHAGWSLTDEALEHLLSKLGSEREQAAEKYLKIHQKLVKLFDWRGCLEAEDLADETIDRVARLLAGGEEILSSDAYPLFRKAAEYIYLERLRNPGVNTVGIEDLSSEKRDVKDSKDLERGRGFEGEEERRLDCMWKCLNSLPSTERDLIWEYEQKDSEMRGKERERFSESLGLSLGALRVRIHRIRTKLKQCRDECMAARTPIQDRNR